MKWVVDVEVGNSDRLEGLTYSLTLYCQKSEKVEKKKKDENRKDRKARRNRGEWRIKKRYGNWKKILKREDMKKR